MIDYDCDEPVDKKELYEEIHRLSKGRITMHLPISKSKKKKSKIKVEEVDDKEELQTNLQQSSPKKAKQHKPFKKRTKLPKVNQRGI